MNLSTRAPLAIIGFGLLCIFGASTRSSADTVFSDSTFNLADYTQTEYLSNPNITVSVDQTLTLGHPGSALQLLVGQPLSNSFSLTVGFINTSFAYDPGTQGALLDVDASVDAFVQSSNRSLNVNTFNPLILQGGNYYIATITNPGGQGTWNTVSAAALTSNDFDLMNFSTDAVDSTQHPDFSGATLSFGLTEGISADGARATTYDDRSDNLVFGLHSAPRLNAAPEPSSLLMLGTASVVAGAAYRRRRG